MIFSDPHLVSVSANHRDPGAGRQGSSRVELQRTIGKVFTVTGHGKDPTRDANVIRIYADQPNDPPLIIIVSISYVSTF